MDRTCGYGHETELLILCGRVSRTETAKERVRTLVKQDLDWDAFLQRAVKNKLYPLVFKTLSEDASGSVPSEVLSRLRSWVFKNAARNERLCQTLGLILEIFEKNGVECLPFKGPLLSLQVYGSPFFRVFSDLDILVRPEQAFAALDLLACHGFTADFRPCAVQAVRYLENENFFRLTGPDAGAVVDLHWEMSGKYGLVPMVLDDLGGEISTARFMERTVMNLRPSILVVYLCLHNASHLWDNLEAVACLAAVLGSPWAPDSRSMMTLARKYRTERVLLTGLRIVEILYQVPLQRIVKEAVSKDRWVENVARRAVARLLEDRKPEGQASFGWRFAVDHLLVRDNALDALHYASRLLFRPTVKEWMHFPASRYSTFRFILRPFRLVLETVRGKGFPVP